MKKILLSIFISSLITSNCFCVSVFGGGDSISYRVPKDEKQLIQRSIDVRNLSGGILPQFSLVRISGATDTQIGVDLVGNNHFPDHCFGMILISLAKNAIGECVVSGMVKGLDTSGYEEDQEIFLSDIKGKFTTVPGPISIGTVQKVDAVDGWILLNIIRT